MPHIDEQTGIKLFNDIGLKCFGSTGQIRKRELFPERSIFGSGEHLEFDYVLIYNSVCIVGEITGRMDKDEIKEKYTKFRDHVNLFSSCDIRQAIRLSDIPSGDYHLFDSIRTIRAFFILPEHEKYDIDVVPHDSLPVLYKSDWLVLREYANYMSSYTKNLFLSLIGLSLSDDQEKDLRIESTKNRLVRETNRIVADVDTKADIFTFMVSPQDILDIAEVFRRELMPLIPPQRRENSDSRYQRPLDFTKLRSMAKLVKKQGFMFPNSILVALDESCRFDSSDQGDILRIPMRYGALSIIDGQHRLFSYASQDVSNETRQLARILVTALQFKTTDKSEILRCSARTFVDINKNQKPITSTHIDEIAYSVLSQTEPRALAAQVILRANQRTNKPLEGMFIARQSTGGVYKAATVFTAVAPIVSMKTINSLLSSSSASKTTHKNGYEKLFKRDGEELELITLTDAEELIQRCVMVIERYSGMIKKIFSKDWPENDPMKQSSLQYTKIFAAFVKLLDQFIKESLDWGQIEAELKKIRLHVLQIQSLSHDYTGVVFAISVKEIPDRGDTIRQSYEFFNRNRSVPTKLSDF